MEQENKIQNRAYGAFKKVRNKIREYYPEQLIIQAIAHLNHPDAAKIEFRSQFKPWLLFLIIKWTIQFGEYSSPDRKDCNKEKFYYVLNMVKEYSANVRMPNEYPNIIMFFRSIIFQQFWLQENYTKSRLARQKILFGDLEKNHRIRKEFKRLTQIELDHFVILGFTLVARFISKKVIFVDAAWFNSIREKFPEGVTEKFLEIISLDIAGAKQFLNKADKKRDFSIEFYEQTPLKKFPLLKIGTRYYCYSADLVSLTIENYIFDTLRQDDPQKFNETFGKIFENYIYQCLEYLSVKFIKEIEIKNFFDVGEKCVDFIIPEEKSNILIDAKGIELPKMGLLTHLKQIIVDKTKTSVIKGIEQGLSTSKKINSNKDLKKMLNNNEDNYLIIISYKDLYVGNGLDFYNNIAKEKMDKLISLYDYTNLPIENMYFLSIDDFELLVQTKKTLNTSFGNILEEIKQKDIKQETKKFIFRQHIEEILDKRKMNREFPNFLEEKFSELADECYSLLK